MTAPTGRDAPEVPPQVALAALVLSRYLFFLTRRPISASNTHYLRRRIAGLTSLGRSLVGSDDAATAKVARLLRTLNPDNVDSVAESIQLVLAPFTRTELPSDVIVAAGPVPPPAWQGGAKVLLVLGPAIGIGDEIITLPLPSWLKDAGLASDVTVMTAYAGLWDRVAGVDAIAHYTDHAELVDAICGGGEGTGRDVVVLVDFEDPNLCEAVAACPTTASRYVEVALGAQTASMLDLRDRFLHRVAAPRSIRGGFYHAFDALMGDLGIPADPSLRFTDVVKHAERGPDPARRVYVSPFSSKYDPSPRYWSDLVGRLLAEIGGGLPVEVVVDPGPNLATRRLAADIAGAVPGDRCSVAPGDTPHGLSLGGELAELDRSDVVVCADSFAAHAAPLFGCTTVVVASPGLERWRVPAPRSFYLDAGAPLSRIAAAVAQVMAVDGGLATLPGKADAERVVAAAEALDRVLEGSGDLGGAFAEFGAACRALRAAQSPATLPLLEDFPYDTPLRPLDAPTDPARRPAVAAYVRARLLEWRGTNLAKLVALGEETM